MLALNRARRDSKDPAESGMVQGFGNARRRSKKFLSFYLDGRSEFEASWNVVRTYLRNGGRGRTLIGAIDDNIPAWARSRAYEEAGRHENCAIMGQNGSPEARHELRKEAQPLHRFGRIFSRKIWRGSFAPGFGSIE